MQIIQQPLIDVLGDEGVRYVIPVFQRVYSWNARQCEELWDDIVRAGQADEPHFMGMLLFSHDPEEHDGLRQIDVIDGQQRMTTMMLLLAAFGPEGFEPAPLALSQMDRKTLDAIVSGDEPGEEPAQRLIDNYLLFARKMEEPGFDARVLAAGLGLLEVATVVLSPEDSPQLVFESLNSKGMPLTTADRVRNLLIASTSGDEQERLYGGLWLPLEEKAGDLAEVMHAWLAEKYRSVRIFDASEVYGVFKTRLREEFSGSLEQALVALGEYCDRYLADDEYRAEARKVAATWIAGKPQDSISEFKLFGD